MPLYTDRINTLLHDRVDDFKQLDAETQLELNTLRQSLDQFQGMDQSSVESAIVHIPKPGAKPTHEQSDLPMIVPFSESWENHTQARQWAMDTLTDVITFAADGSQISPAREMSIPIGLVQIGWFRNHHSTSVHYEKDVAVTLLTPNEFDQAVDKDPQREVEWQRFLGEANAIIKFMETYHNQPALALFDGSFIVSFVGGMQPDRQQLYTDIVQYLLHKSTELRVPLIGFIDNSYSSDVSTLIQHAVGRQQIIRHSDATLFTSEMRWGDRTRVYLCSRDDEVVDNTYYQQVAIAYVKTTQHNPPARIEFPKWMLDESLADWAINILRAECTVGLGYPYPIETADATAVLTMQDRERFHRLFQEFTEREAIPLRFSRKSMSKRGRR